MPTRGEWESGGTRTALRVPAASTVQAAHSSISGKQRVPGTFALARERHVLNVGVRTLLRTRVGEPLGPETEAEAKV